MIIIKPLIFYIIFSKRKKKKKKSLKQRGFPDKDSFNQQKVHERNKINLQEEDTLNVSIINDSKGYIVNY